MDNAPVAKATKTTHVSERSYLAMMLFAFFGGQLGLARVYRGDIVLGWTRFWTFISVYILYVITFFFMPLQLVMGIILFGLSVWGVVDFFILYGTKVDAAKHTLIHNKLDARIAKILLILSIIGLSIALIVVILAVVFGLATMSGFAPDTMRTWSFSQMY